MLVRRDMKQTELAARLGVNEMWLSRRLRGAQPIDLNDLARIAEVLGVTAADLLPGRREGHVVYVGGAQRQTTQPYSGQPKRTSPFSQPKRTSPKRLSSERPSLRRPARVSHPVA